MNFTPQLVSPEGVVANLVMVRGQESDGVML
jgi:hypothetical protein